MRVFALFLFVVLALPLSAARAESIVAGLSQNEVSITADFIGSEILIYGAVRRDAPPDGTDPLQVVITIQGPSAPATIRRKAYQYGIWMNADQVTVSSAPSFYAIASSGPLEQVLSETENLRYSVTIPRAIRTVGMASTTTDGPRFLDALVRLRQSEGRYLLAEDTVDLVEETLFRTDVGLPANLVEGDYRVRMFITRGGKVIDTHEEVILVQKAGFERWLYNLAHEHSLIYGLLALLLAVVAGWGASAGFALLRR